MVLVAGAVAAAWCGTGVGSKAPKPLSLKRVQEFESTEE